MTSRMRLVGVTAALAAVLFGLSSWMHQRRQQAHHDALDVFFEHAVPGGIDPTLVLVHDEEFQKSKKQQQEEPDEPKITCESALQQIAFRDFAFENTAFRLHRNGESSVCGSSRMDLLSIQRGLESLENCDDLTKYEVESLLTRLFAKKVESCISNFCDMGPEHTPILLDYDKLVPLPQGTLPCRFFTREGVRIVSMEQLAELARIAHDDAALCMEEGHKCGDVDEEPELHLYAVPAGRQFMFAASHVGEIFDLSHVQEGVEAQVLSIEPRVFEITNFFTQEEADDLIDKAVKETAPGLAFHRSTTGASSNRITSRRTSENAFVLQGTARELKRRGFKTLGFDEYLEQHADGLQITRYNVTNAYVPHMDCMEDPTKSEAFDFDSSGKGGNRFATFVFYLTDMNEGDGGETVFPDAWPRDLPESQRQDLPQALEQMRRDDTRVSDLLSWESWEEEMAALCRSRMTVRPRALRTLLFYNLHPNGKLDYSSKHGACPVLDGQKYSANLWVWTTPRGGYEGAPVNEGGIEQGNGVLRVSRAPRQKRARFYNKHGDPKYKKAVLFYDEDTYWGRIGDGDPPLQAFTYEGHRWNIKVDGKTLKTFVIGKQDTQVFFV